jgi:hypothetical protein
MIAVFNHSPTLVVLRKAYNPPIKNAQLDALGLLSSMIQGTQAGEARHTASARGESISGLEAIADPRLGDDVMRGVVVRL